MTNIKIYIVGGYCRDDLLGHESKDYDYVVVGANHEWMINAGFKQVGADFPVYLHHESNDEYALARTERKVGPGYHGFETDFSSTVTLEEDLSRRDLTINAMAREVISWDENNVPIVSDEIIDPFNGQEDLTNGVLRHVSDAFGDDPVRVLRIARFACRYEFYIAHETFDMMKWMVRSGELDHLTTERVWIETTKAMMENNPMNFFNVLDMCGALNATMPRLMPRRSTEALVSIIKADAPLILRFAILTAFMNVEDCKAFYQELKAPSNITEFAIKVNWMVSLFEKDLLISEQYSGVSVIDLLEKLNAFKDSTILEMLHKTLPHINKALDYYISMLRQVFSHVSSISFNELDQSEQTTLQGREIGAAIKSLQIGAANKMFK